MSRLAISGAIAVGKTTLVENLQRLDPTVAVWLETPAKHSFLQSFYDDPTKFAFHSRVEFLVAKSIELRKSSDRDDICTLFDRSLIELVTFARAMVRLGILSSREYKLYDDLWATLIETLPSFDAFVWLHCDSAVCLDRIAERARPYERGIDLRYLDLLDLEYKTWREEIRGVYPVLEIDTTDRSPQQTSDEVFSWMVARGFARF